MSETRCTGWSAGSGGWGDRCRQSLRTDEQRKAGLCGRHLAGRRRRAATDAKHREQAADSKRLRDAANDACAQLARHGIDASPEYRTGFGSTLGGYTGRVIVDAEQVLRALSPVHQVAEGVLAETNPEVG